MVIGELSKETQATVASGLDTEGIRLLLNVLKQIFAVAYHSLVRNMK